MSFQEKLRAASKAAKESRKESEERRKIRESEDLKRILNKKATTILIGCISRFEDAYGPLILNDKELWGQCRAEILDFGNKNIRAMLKEFEQHEVKRLEYVIEIEGEKNG